MGANLLDRRIIAKLRSIKPKTALTTDLGLTGQYCVDIINIEYHE
jgi:hypothetical protein